MDGSASVGGIVGGNGIFSYTWVDAVGNDLGQDVGYGYEFRVRTYTVTVTDQMDVVMIRRLRLKRDVLVANT